MENSATSFFNDGEGYKSYKSIWWLLFHVTGISLGSMYIGLVISYFSVVTQNYCMKPQTGNFLVYLQNGMVPLGAIFGSCILSHFLYKYTSRRNTLVIASILGMIGSLLVSLFILTSTNQDSTQGKCNITSSILVYVGRFAQGLGAGIFSVNCPLIINELSPLEIKIALGAFYQVTIVLGICINRSLQLLYDQSNEDGKQYNKWTTVILPCVPILVLILEILFAFLYFKIQTPKYLISQGKIEEAKSLISEIYKSECSREVYLDKEAQYNLEERISQSSFFSEFDMFKIKGKALFLGIYVSILQQISGINFFNVYGNPSENTVYKKDWQRYRLLISTTIQLTTAVLFAFLGFSRSFGQRKQKLVWGTFVALGVHILVTIFGFVLDNGSTVQQICFFVMLCIFMASFGFTLGPVVWLYTPQIMEPSQLQKAIGVNWFIALLSITCFPLLPNVPQKQHWYFTGSIISIVFLVFFAFYNGRFVIETKNKSSLQITRIIHDVDIPSPFVSLCSKSQ